MRCEKVMKVVNCGVGNYQPGCAFTIRSNDFGHTTWKNIIIICQMNAFVLFFLGNKQIVDKQISVNSLSLPHSLVFSTCLVVKCSVLYSILLLLLFVSLFCWIEVSQGPPAAFQPILNSIPFQKQNGLRRCVVNIAQNNPVRLGNAPLCTVGRE